MKPGRLIVRPFLQRGVSIITAVFLLLLFAGLAALMANVISASHTTAAADLLGARGYQSARAGVEWGLFKIFQAPDGYSPSIPKEDGNCGADVVLPNCPTTAFPGGGLDGFQVNVACQPFPDAASVYYEGCRRVRIYRITATARGPGPLGQTVEREVQVTVERCMDASGATPAPC